MKNIIERLTLLLIIISAVVLQSCNSENRNTSQTQSEFSDEDYEAGQTDAPVFRGVRLLSQHRGFKVPESAAVDSRNNYIYVSNINGEPDEKNGMGYVTRVMLSGEIIDTLNIQGLNAPKGMALSGNLLYIADIDRVVVYNTDSQQVVKIFEPQGAEFLNDISIDAENNIYISDSKAGQLFKIASDKIETYIADSLCVNANGLCRSDACMAMGAGDRILVVNPLNATKKVFANLSFTPDGLKYHNDITYIASDFVGNIFAVSPNACRLLLGAREGVNAADFEYLPEQNILIVPTFFNNTIDIYEIGLD